MGNPAYRPSGSSLVQFFDCRSPDAAELGGKGASLCRLVANGNLVPPGFIITVGAFERTSKALGLANLVARAEELLASDGDLGEAGEEILDRFKQGQVPREVVDAVNEAVDALGLWNGPNPRVIVRSSATVEDSAAHSFAGIFESVPISAPGELESTLREIWSSVFSARALSYYREIGLTRIPAMALVIQRFISAERSGVMFTTFGGRTLVEHVEGDCEKLVKGEVTPEQLWLSGIDRRPESTGSLADKHVTELARLARQLEVCFNGPQDVEWVLYDGEIQIVQSRPVTTSLRESTSAPAPEEIDETLEVLRGTGASGGWGAGKVHLAFNIEDVLALASGKVLVTPMTNPDMVVAMRKSSAIVTDVGGMICHAAIVSRELGLPCVVGTAHATTTLVADEPVTVSGDDGKVYRGSFAHSPARDNRSPVSWQGIWSVWSAGAGLNPSVVPIVPTIEALESVPSGVGTIVLSPDIDLRCNADGLWADIEGMSDREADALVGRYADRVAEVCRHKTIERLFVAPGDGLPSKVHAQLSKIAPTPPVGLIAIPLVSPSRSPGSEPPVPPLSGMEEATDAALDTIKFFGHEPGGHRSQMPAPKFRGAWWNLLAEYGRFHNEHHTENVTGEFTWLEVRPELVISPMLKSLVQPGFEMVPRIMGFAGQGPMHVKWRRCRYHFRSDTFALVWRSIVRATWDAGYMADLMRRVRASYENLASVVALFPKTQSELENLSPSQIEALITSWWPRWVEFFALCWFIQAQGDDILYPFIEETVRDNLRRVPDSTEFRWPGAQDLVAPTTPVLSGEYMTDVMRLRKTLLDAGLNSAEQAIEELEADRAPAVAAQVSKHLSRWHWMRDRDLLFEPWDTPARVIRTALETDAHSTVSYNGNLRRQILALGIHSDLARASGRAEGLQHAVRFLHDLNVERENHHVLWLKYSDPLRQLVLEVERRLVAVGSLRPGEIFFLQAPELIAAARDLPAQLTEDLVETIRNRRAAFRHEARLELSSESVLSFEDDYF